MMKTSNLKIEGLYTVLKNQAVAVTCQHLADGEASVDSQCVSIPVTVVTYMDTTSILR